MNLPRGEFIRTDVPNSLAGNITLFDIICYVTLAFDPSFNGESGGNVRLASSPDINTEDFSASVDYLVCLDNVDSERIGIIGICGFGGLAISAAALDPRIKATVSSTMGSFDDHTHESIIEERSALSNESFFISFT